MKKFKILKVIGFFLLILAAMLIIGCERILIPDDPPVVVPVKYTIKIFAVNGTITPSSTMALKGSSKTFHYIPYKGYEDIDYITNNEIKMDPLPVMINNDLILTEINDDYNIVIVFKKTKVKIMSDILESVTWKTYRWQSRFATEPDKWYIDKYLPEASVETVTFDGTYKLVIDSRGIIVENYKYQLTPDSLFINNGLHYKIVELSTEKFVTDNLSIGFDSPGVPNPAKNGITRITCIPK